MDINNDSFLDIYFYVVSGFAYLPRQYFCYDVVNDTIISSSPFGAYLSRPRVVTDRATNTDLIIAECFAVSNYDSAFANIAYADTCLWLMVMNKNFEYLFEPIFIAPRNNFFDLTPITRNDSTYLLINISNYGSNSMRQEIYNLKGEKISEIKLEDTTLYDKVFLGGNNFDCDYSAFFVKKEGTIFMLNPDFKTYTTKKLLSNNLDQCVDYLNFDLNKDGKIEKIINCGSSFLIVSNNLKSIVKVNLNDANFRYTSVITKENKTYFSLYSGSFVYLLTYFKNPLFKWRFVIYFAIFLGILFLLTIFQYVRTYQLEMENLRLTELVNQRTFCLQRTC